jgi:hypothetical protein
MLRSDRPRITARKKAQYPRRAIFETLDRLIYNYENPMMNGYYIREQGATRDSAYLIQTIQFLAEGPVPRK